MRFAKRPGLGSPSRRRRMAEEREGVAAEAAHSIKALGALATVPGAIAIGLLVLSFGVIWLDELFAREIADFADGFFVVPYETAKSILTTLAAGSLTTLGLVYSLILVVFTTAAGNIGPRLLQRFTDDRLNQTTAGIFGGTFLFALAALYATSPERVPILSLAVALLISILAVLQLLLFVQSAARSVTVDEEVAAISTGLEVEMRKLADIRLQTRNRDTAELPEFPSHEDASVDAPLSGYLTETDTDALAEWARTHGVVLEMLRAPGEFTLRGQPLVRASRVLSTNQRRLLRVLVKDAVPIRTSRTPEADVAFSVHLLVEIALRALSPGVNDTYTAIACIDRLSAALAVAVREGLPGEVRLLDGEPRLVVPGTTLAGLVKLAFGPLRRAAQGNVLMLAAIFDALARLHDVAEPGSRAARLIREHARLALGAATRSDLQNDDLAFLRQRHAGLYRSD